MLNLGVIGRRCRKLFRITKKLISREPAPAPPAPAPPRAYFSNVSAALLANTPILIPVFNNPTYLGGMLDQLSAKGLHNIIVVDNASTSRRMRKFLDRIDRRIAVVRLRANRGPRDICKSPENLRRLPDVFCVTDPDLELNPELPDDFLVELFKLTEEFRIGKAGFSLDISDPASMRDDIITFAGGQCKIWEWEARFWQDQLGVTAGGDPVYKANIDTTFALYNKAFFRPEKFTAAVRVAGRYTCRHLPWYKHSPLPEGEEQYYRRTQKFSTYLASR